jgi:predicted DNA-binding transcriptional regulator AlpA
MHRRRRLMRKRIPDSNMNRTALSATRPVPRRGLSRVEAAMYIGISVSKFDELVHDGRMPNPKRIDGRKVWDVRALDLAFDLLPGDNGQASKNSFDDAWTPR